MGKIFKMWENMSVTDSLPAYLKSKIVKLKELYNFSFRRPSIFSICLAVSYRHIVKFLPKYMLDGQGGRGWQPFSENKNGHTNFRLA